MHPSPSLRPIRILFDWRVMYDGIGGNVRIFNTVAPILAAHFPFEWRFLCRRRPSIAPPLDGPALARLPWPFRHFPESKVKAWAWGRWADRQPRALYHTPYLSLIPCRRTPILGSVLDCITELFAAELDPAVSVLRERKREMIARSARLQTISECSKRDICKVFGIAPERIDVVPLGVDHAVFSAPASPHEIAVLRGKLGFDGPFLLGVGGRADHKNFSTFLEAFATSTLHKDVRLVAAGGPFSAEESKRIEHLGVTGRVQVYPWPSDLELRGLYQLCSAMVYPSLYEGFGLPPLEAMAAGAPIAVSTGGSIPEVIGDAGWYFEPRDPTAMAKAIGEAISAGRTAPRVALGRKRAATFTWERCADALAECYFRTVGIDVPAAQLPAA